MGDDLLANPTKLVGPGILSHFNGQINRQYDRRHPYSLSDSKFPVLLIYDPGSFSSTAEKPAVPTENPSPLPRLHLGG